ncbi:MULTISPECIES: hypothetical protein [unclassified Streptomyces]|uniref:hypothetical protein n=1 Tax=unclassified Streptomyces TaxID=2593676 RepID=UPI0037FE5873
MTNPAASPDRFTDPAHVAGPRPAGRGLVIEELDAASDAGHALLCVCVVAAPCFNTPASAPRFE